MTPNMPLIETIFTKPIKNPSTNGVSRTFQIGGKIDIVDADEYSRLFISDWKTCSNALQAQRRRMLSYQADLYACAMEDTGLVIDYASFRLIERPTIKLCSKDATPEDYENRCMEWLSQDGKLVEFSIPSTNERRISARQWLWDISQQILEARRSGRFLPNENACYCYNHECPYMNLCLAKAQGHDWGSILEAEYVLARLHPELEGLEDEKDLLTYSSCSAFCLCQAKYYWRYEMFIKPMQDEESEALNNGISVHKGLEIAFTQNLEAGLDAVSPATLGIDSKGQQDRAKARAMVRAAFGKWGEKA